MYLNMYMLQVVYPGRFRDELKYVGEVWRVQLPLWYAVVCQKMNTVGIVQLQVAVGISYNANHIGCAANTESFCAVQVGLGSHNSKEPGQQANQPVHRSRKCHVLAG